MKNDNKLIDRVYAALGNDKGKWEHVLSLYREWMKREYAFFSTPHSFDKYDIWYYNKHDFEHINRVCNFIHELIEKMGLDLSVDELLVMYFAALGHDVAMCKYQIKSQVGYEKALGKPMTGVDWRKMHASQSANIVDRFIANHANGESEVAVKLRELRHPIHEIISKHEKLGVEGGGNGEYKNLRIPLMLALLRIADRCDATEVRLPSEEIVGQIVALASTVNGSLKTQIEHYLRRLITIDVSIDEEEGKPIVNVRILPFFKDQIVSTPRGAKGIERHVTGEDAFIGVLEEFFGELGDPINAKCSKVAPYLAKSIERIKEREMKGETSSKLLELNAMNLRWQVVIIPYGSDISPTIADWMSCADDYRKFYDNAPHPWEQQMPTTVPVETSNHALFKNYLSSIINTSNDIIDNYYIELIGDVMEVSENGAVAYSPGNIYNYVDEWLVKENKNLIVILGEYGCGKTTFCQKYAHDLADRYMNNYEKSDFRIPIVIKLSGYGKSPNIKKSLIEELQKQSCEIENFETISKLNGEGKLLFILDGLDEALPQGGDDPTTKLFNSITQFAHEKSKIILTCRTEFFRTSQEIIDLLQYPDRRKSSIVVSLKKLNTLQIKEYLQKKFPEKWNCFWPKIGEVPGLKDLARRPVLLNIITDHLPSLLKNKQEVDTSFLYEHCIKDELKRKVLNIETTIESEERLSLMRELAIRMYRRGGNEIRHEMIPNKLYFEKLFGPLRGKELREYVHDFLSCSFLARDNDGFYSFSHSSFKDFFVAGVLLDEIKTNKPDVFKSKIIGYEIMNFMKEKPITVETLFEWIHRDGEVEEGFLGSNVLSLLNSIGWDFTDNRFIGFNDRNDLRYLDLHEANLRGAQFERSNLERANFHSADLSNAKFVNARLQSADLRFAILANADFTSANLTGARIEELETINEVAWSPNGRYICCTDTKGRIIIFEKIENRGDYLYFTLFKIFGNHKSSVNTISWFADNKKIVSGSSDETVSVWDIDIGHVNSFHSLSGSVKTVRVIQGNYILAAFQNGDVRLFNIESGEYLSDKMDCLYKFNRNVTAYATNSKGNILFAGHDDGKISILIFDINSKPFKIFDPIQNNMPGVGCMSLAPNEKQLYVAYADKKIRIWDLDSQSSDIISESNTIEGHGDRGSITALSISLDSNILASGDSWGRVILWDISDPLNYGRIDELIIENESITSLSFSSNGNFLAGADSNGILKIWELGDRNETKGYIHYIIPDCKDMVFAHATGVSEGLEKTLQSCGAKRYLK